MYILRKKALVMILTISILTQFLISSTVLGLNNEEAKKEVFNQNIDEIDNEVSNLLNQWAQAINLKNLEDYLSVFTQASRKDIENTINVTQQEDKKYLEFFSIESISFKDNKIKTLSKKDTETLYLLHPYIGKNSKVFYFTFDAKVFDDMKNKYTIDGKNYVMCVLEIENNKLKVKEFFNAPVKDMVKKGISLGTDKELNILENENNIQEFSLSLEGYNISLTPPTNIRIKLTHNENLIAWRAAYGQVVTNSFDTYIRDVLPNEWDSDKVVSDCKNTSTYLYQSLYSGALLVKTYGWYMATLGWHRSYGFDVYDNTNDQRYSAGSRYKTSQDEKGVYFQWGNMCNSSINTMTGRVIVDESTYQVGEIHYGQDQQNATYNLDKNGYTYSGIIDNIYPTKTIAVH